MEVSLSNTPQLGAPPRRMTVNVQDYVIVGSFVFILCLLLGLQRLLLFAIAHSRRKQHERPLAAAENYSAS